MCVDSSMDRNKQKGTERLGGMTFVICHMSYVMCQMSGINYHVSHVMCCMSPVTYDQKTQTTFKTQTFFVTTNTQKCLEVCQFQRYGRRPEIFRLGGGGFSVMAHTNRHTTDGQRNLETEEENHFISHFWMLYLEQLLVFFASVFVTSKKIQNLNKKGRKNKFTILET